MFLDNGALTTQQRQTINWQSFCQYLAVNSFKNVILVFRKGGGEAVIPSRGWDIIKGEKSKKTNKQKELTALDHCNIKLVS